MKKTPEKHYYAIEVTYGSAFQAKFGGRLLEVMLKSLKEHMESSHRFNDFKWSELDLDGKEQE